MKKLYRMNSSDPERCFLGILGGIGQYFNVDGTIIRLIFLLLFFFTDFVSITILYFLCYLLIPEYPCGFGKDNNEDPKDERSSKAEPRNKSFSESSKNKEVKSTKVWDTEELQEELDTHKDIINNEGFKKKVDEITEDLGFKSKKDSNVEEHLEPTHEVNTESELQKEDENVEYFEIVHEEKEISNPTTENIYKPKEITDTAEESNYFKEVRHIENPPKDYNDNTLDKELRVSEVSAEIEEITHISNAR